MEKRALIAILVIVIIVAGGAAYYWFVMPHKPTISFTIYYNTGNVQREQLASLLASEWGKLGFKVTVQGLEWPVLLDKIMNPDEFDVYIIGWAPDYIDPDDYAGPMAYGGTQFKSLNVFTVASAADVSNHLKSAIVYDVGDYAVVVGEKGTGASVTIPSGKTILVVQYEVDEQATKPVGESTPWVNINPGMYRNATGDALIKAGTIVTNPSWREAIYNAVQQHTNQELPLLWIGQYLFLHGQWTWVYGWYYHPVMPIRFDLIWENASAPDVKIGTLGKGKANTPQKDYYNNESVVSISTFGWPESFDPAADYETFGWAIFWQTGDPLVTYWKTETEYVSKDLAVAWAYSDDGLDYYFVIRGGVKAYNRWADLGVFGGNKTDEVYNISAIDVLFSLWRIAALELDPSWMITSYVNVSASEVMTESEFNNTLKTGNLKTDFKGKVHTPTNLSDLLKFFGSEGSDTAGVVHIKLTQPYPAILPILADAFTIPVPMKYVFDALGWNYTEAVEASNNGKNPDAWAQWINGTLGEDEPTHRLLHEYPVATGPFYVYDYLDNQWIILKKNPYYWNQTLYSGTNYGQTKYVIYSIQSETEPRLALYTSGAADFCAVPLDRVSDVNNTYYEGTNWHIIEKKDPNLLTYDIVYVVWNTYKFPFNNPLVRRALAYATPYEQIYSQVYSNFTEPLYGVIPKGMPGWTDYNIIHYTYDLDKAKALIKASGIFGTSASLNFIVPPLFIALPPILMKKEEE